MVPLIGLQCVIVVFPDHTHLLFFNCHEIVDLTFNCCLLCVTITYNSVTKTVAFTFGICHQKNTRKSLLLFPV